MSLTLSAIAVAVVCACVSAETVVSIGGAGSLAPAAGLVCMLAALVSMLML